MENQEQEIIKEKGGVESAAAAAFSVLPTLLNSISSMTTTSDGVLLEKCTNSGVSPKREPPSSLEQPSPKRATHASASTSASASASASTNHHFTGYTKLQLLHPLPSSLQGSVSGFSALTRHRKRARNQVLFKKLCRLYWRRRQALAKRHKKIEERIKEINQLCNQILRELKESKDEERVIKDQNLTEIEEPTEKVVWYEK